MSEHHDAISKVSNTKTYGFEHITECHDMNSMNRDPKGNEVRICALCDDQFSNLQIKPQFELTTSFESIY